MPSPAAPLIVQVAGDPFCHIVTGYPTVETINTQCNMTLGRKAVVKSGFLWHGVSEKLCDVCRMYAPY